MSVLFYIVSLLLVLLKKGLSEYGNKILIVAYMLKLIYMHLPYSNYKSTIFLYIIV